MYTILQIIISIVVVYLIFSTVVNIIVEGISSLFQLRGKMLKRAIGHLLEENRLGEKVYEHPRISCLTSPDQKLPSYISAGSFSSALIDVVASGAKAEATENSIFQNFLNGIQALGEGSNKTLLGTFADNTRDLESLTKQIEKWFNDSMDRVSGWYKRKTKKIIIMVAVIVTIGCNVDTIYIVRTAQADPVLRQRLNDLGDRLIADTVFVKAGTPTHDTDYYEDYVNDTSISSGDSVLAQIQDQKAPPSSSTTFDERLTELQYLNQLISESDLPIGWTIKTKTDWLFRVLGWMLTVFALSAGAPFWFEVLKGFVNIRGTGPRPVPNK